MATLTLYVNGAPGIKYELDKACVTIGRDFDNDICLDDPGVSERHALIEAKAAVQADRTNEYSLIDLDGTDTCLVNNRPTSRAVLADGDYVRIGSHLFKYTAEAVRLAPTRTPRPAADVVPTGQNAPELPTQVQVANARGAQEFDTHEFDTKFSRRLRML